MIGAVLGFGNGEVADRPEAETTSTLLDLRWIKKGWGGFGVGVI